MPFGFIMAERAGQCQQLGAWRIVTVQARVTALERRGVGRPQPFWHSAIDAEIRQILETPEFPAFAQEPWPILGASGADVPSCKTRWSFMPRSRKNRAFRSTASCGIRFLATIPFSVCLLQVLEGGSPEASSPLYNLARSQGIQASHVLEFYKCVRELE
jgi:hypothetical protein